MNKMYDEIKIDINGDFEEIVKVIANKIPYLRELFHKIDKKELEETELESVIDEIRSKIEDEKDEKNKERLEEELHEMEEKLQKLRAEIKELKEEQEKMENEIISAFDAEIFVTYECVSECELYNELYPAIVIPLDADGIFWFDIAPGLRVEVKYK